jgi:hypothetical protein
MDNWFYEGAMLNPKKLCGEQLAFRLVAELG